jgi:hypothetical protein
VNFRDWLLNEYIAPLRNLQFTPRGSTYDFSQEIDPAWKRGVSGLVGGIGNVMSKEFRDKGFDRIQAPASIFPAVNREQPFTADVVYSPIVGDPKGEQIHRAAQKEVLSNPEVLDMIRSGQIRREKIKIAKPQYVPPTSEHPAHWIVHVALGR